MRKKLILIITVLAGVIAFGEIDPEVKAEITRVESDAVSRNKNAWEGIDKNSGRLDNHLETLSNISKSLSNNHVYAQVEVNRINNEMEKSSKIITDTTIRSMVNEGNIEENKKSISDNTIKINEVRDNNISENKRIEAKIESVANDTIKLVSEMSEDIKGNRDLAVENSSKIQSENEARVKENKRIDAKIDNVANHHERLINQTDERVEKNHNEINDRVDGVEAVVDKNHKELTERVDDAEGRVAEIDEKLYEHGLTRKKVLKSDVNRAMIEGTNDKVNAQGEAIATNIKSTEENKEKIEKNTTRIESNTKRIENNASKIEDNTNGIQRNSDRIDRIDNRIQSLESEMNRGFAMSAATSSIVYPELDEGDLGVGAGIGGYGNSQAVAIGLAMQPSEAFRVNANVSTSDGQDVMYGAGMGYKFNLFN
ncbi:adhesin YadA [Propionigenium maris DSM 9537]|uniref:Adhesin YadA n=1 Tax=Propionigenium maris DSM 9537 TaxID=1123000 RepID=A0A9W6GM67_9FUSO|nr:YadA-like family protein [Propionigenium maris]GLI56271.1 adhesin YadA [Propionigenium maris DSM 9537]